MRRLARKVRRALRMARAIIGISAGAGLESDDSDDEIVATLLDSSHSTGQRRRASSQPPPAAPVQNLSLHPSLPDLRELTEASTPPSVWPSTPPSSGRLVTSPGSTTVAVGERDVVAVYGPPVPPPVWPSTPPSPVGLATSPGSTTAAVWERDVAAVYGPLVPLS